MLSRDNTLQKLQSRCSGGDADACLTLKQGVAQGMMGSGAARMNRERSKAFKSNLQEAFNQNTAGGVATKYRYDQKTQNILGQVDSWINSDFSRSERQSVYDSFVDTANKEAQKSGSRYATSVGIQKAVNALRGRGYEGDYYKDPGAGRMPIAKGTKKYAEGGDVSMDEESLLAPPPEMMEPEEDPLLAKWAPLIEVLGEEAFMEVAALAEEFPVVGALAEMAMKTSDGAVEGMGGPEEDMVPARLSDGEFVFSAEAVEVIGIDTLENMHNEAKRMAGSLV